VRSQLGAGSEFTLRIPVRYRDTAPEYVAPALEWVRDPNSIPVLVVEDSPEMVMMYKNYLRGSGFQMLHASTIREAEGILDHVRPKAIILDIVLRSEDSWAFVPKLKQDSHTKDIPVLVASTIEDRAKGFHLGVDRYLLKPIERTELIRELRVLTGQAPMNQVLIIDDEERDRYLLKQKLKNLPLLIMEAETGTEGFRMACTHKPSLILLDLGMPDLTGFEVLDKFKSVPAMADVPIVIVTSRVLTSAERARAMQRAFEIVGKENLEYTDFGDVFRRATAGTLQPGKGG
jgi:CheY-like chemotaxis protein